MPLQVAMERSNLCTYAVDPQGVGSSVRDLERMDLVAPLGYLVDTCG